MVYKHISKENKLFLALIGVLSLIVFIGTYPDKIRNGESDCAISRGEAEEIATKWLESNDINWGGIESVEYFDANQEYHRQEFHVHYDPPTEGEVSKEHFVIYIDPTVVINCMTGEVREGLYD